MLHSFIVLSRQTAIVTTASNHKQTFVNYQWPDIPLEGHAHSTIFYELKFREIRDFFTNIKTAGYEFSIYDDHETGQN